MPLESFPSRLTARFFSAKTASFLTSASCGILIVCWAQQALAGFGTSLVGQTALLLVALMATGMALSAASHLGRQRTWLTPNRQIPLLVVLQTILVAAVLLSPLFQRAGWFIVDLLLNETLPSTAGQLAILTAGVMTTWLLPITAAALMLLRPRPECRVTGTTAPLSQRLAVSSFAATAAMIALSGHTGLNGMVWIGLGTGLLATILETMHLLRIQQTVNQEATTINGEDRLAGETTLPAADESPIRRATPVACILAVVSGILFSSLSRINGQLFFAASWQSVLQWSSVLLVALYCRRAGVRQLTWPVHALIIAAAWSVAIPAAWPALVQLCLSINASISSVMISGTLRAIITVACITPVGIVLGAATVWRNREKSNEVSTRSSRVPSLLLLTSFATGWLTCRWWLTFLMPPSLIVSVLAIVLVTVALSRSIGQWSWRSAVRPLPTCGLIAVLAGTLLSSQYDPTRSAKLLFDTAVFVAHQHEARTDTLPYLDEGRCIATAESNHGTLTFWRYRGHQIQVRESGIPHSSVSCDTSICTQPSAESLQAILPMVLHEGPARVLLLGMRSGAVLQTSIAFPLESIVCVDPDQNVINAVSDQVLAQVTPNPLDDSRVTIERAEPLLKLRSAPDQADVIIAATDQQGTPHAATMITAEFLTTASSALREDGLYCQPLDHADFGPDAFQIIVATWQSVFSEVAAIEIAPGKLLMIGTNSPSGIIRPGIIERLQRPNVRFALAQTGWDWSTPLRLSVYNDQGLSTAFESSAAAVSDVASSRLTCLLPWEVMRWGDKYSDTMQKLTPIGQTLQFTIGEDAYSREVKNRLAELTEQQELIHEHPDEYWYYRRKVKERLTKTPQSELVQVKGEEPLHELQEDEKRRVDYFKTLGAAAKQKQPGTADLNAIAEFAAPHDPLISLFLHQELAELATRDRDRHAQTELLHRLHRIYFTAASDEAVRNVIACIEILCDHPETISDEAHRADQLDSLLQVLHDRWHNRGNTPPGSSKIVLNDIEQSVAAIDRAFEQLESLSPARGYTSEQWQSRRLALEKSLLRPLQAYRTTLMPHHARVRTGR